MSRLDAKNQGRFNTAHCGTLKSMEKKWCVIGEHEVSTSEFYPRAGVRSGLQSSCKDCMRKKVREYARTPAARKVNREWRLANPESSERKLFESARRRAREHGLPFEISKEDVIIPEFCPVLGVKLVPGNRKGPRPDAPSLDRIVPSKGYVPGNVQVISYKANTMKQNATPEELEAFARWVLGSGVFADVKA